MMDNLTGMAIRGGHMLNLDLPSILWKPLVGQPVTRADLRVGVVVVVVYSCYFVLFIVD